MDFVKQHTKIALVEQNNKLDSRLQSMHKQKKQRMVPTGGDEHVLGKLRVQTPNSLASGKRGRGGLTTESRDRGKKRVCEL